MRIIFETEDVSCVSPATISRCGVAYLHPNSIEYRSLIDSFFVKINDIKPDLIDQVKELILESFIKS